MSYLTRAVGAVKLFGKAHGPTIMVVSGVAAMGAGAVLGAKQTLHVESVLKPHVENLETIEETHKNQPQGYIKGSSHYSDKMYNKDRMVIFGRVGRDLAKVYAVPVVLFGGGAALVFGGHHIMVQRQATLALAFTALQKSFDRYRGRVVENYGSEADQAMMSGYVNREVWDDESNSSQMVSSRDWDEVPGDIYARVFGEGQSSEWENDLGANKMFVQNQQRFANELLSRQGYLFLSEVYKSLGFEESPTSRVVGWKVKRLPDGSRDIPFVDFGLDKPHPDDWKFSKENAIYLDFNCQGLIVGGKIQALLEKA